jgi:hypothetical protein
MEMNTYVIRRKIAAPSAEGLGEVFVDLLLLSRPRDIGAITQIRADDVPAWT